MNVRTFWSEKRWTRAFGYRPPVGTENPYTLKYHIGQDVAAADWFVDIPALRGGVVVASGRGALIGGYVTLRAYDGLYDTYCHLNSASLPRKGDVLRAGGGVAPPARSKKPSAGHDYMGSAATGPHQHFVVSRRIDTASNPRAADVVDPRPIIRAALASTASDSSRPFNPQEDDMFDDKDRALLQDIKNRLSYSPDPGYSIPQQIAQDTEDIRNRIRGPRDVPWDSIQRILSVVEGLANAGTPGTVDVPKLLGEVEERLKATFQDQFEEMGVALRAEIIAALPEGGSRDDVNAAVDAALATLRIERAS